MTQRMLRFCDEYLALGESNASEAARRAGYSKVRAGITAAEVLGRPDVKEYLAQKRAPIVRELADRHRLTLERVMQEDALIALSDIGDLVEVQGGKFRLKDVTAVRPDVRRAIASISTSPDGTIGSIRLWDKGAALARLGKLLQSLPPEQEELTFSERAQKLAEILESGMRRRAAQLALAE